MRDGGAFDWLARVIMLVLAGMVSLSIIGSIAAIPSGSLPSRIGMESPPQPPPAPDAAGGRAAAPQPANEAQAEPGNAASATLAAAAPPPEKPDPDRWLEAITYALLALTGLAALAVLLLWSSLRERRRLADALEAIAGRDRR